MTVFRYSVVLLLSCQFLREIQLLPFLSSILDRRTDELLYGIFDKGQFNYQEYRFHVSNQCDEHADSLFLRTLHIWRLFETLKKDNCSCILYEPYRRGLWIVNITFSNRVLENSRFLSQIV